MTYIPQFKVFYRLILLQKAFSITSGFNFAICDSSYYLILDLKYVQDVIFYFTSLSAKFISLQLLRLLVMKPFLNMFNETQGIRSKIMTSYSRNMITQVHNCYILSMTHFGFCNVSSYISLISQAFLNGGRQFGNWHLATLFLLHIPCCPLNIIKKIIRHIH